mmetsp:Transcript_7077/g.10137  ORF Transcript_7077/g.10137 Transcript_7077/m.10137 type:complete len:372 (-) Transcript_7077:216-1331(-)
MISSKVAWRGEIVIGIAISAVALITFYNFQHQNHGQNDKKGNGGKRAKSNATTNSSSNGEMRNYNWQESSVELPTHVEREIIKEQRRQAKVPHLARKSPMYDNVQMLSPDGELLSSISTKKGRWYVKKGLAKWVNNDEQTKQVQINFEPKGRAARGGSGTYMKTEKRNVCVCCGKDEHIMRHYVVPYAYRQLFPPKFKSHLSHDIVILCPKCHLHCEQQTQKRSKEIDAMHRPPTSREDDDTSQKFVIDKHLKKIRSAGLTLMNWKHKVPPEKIAEYDAMVRLHLGLDDDSGELTTQHLQTAIDVQYKIFNPHYISGAELVLRSMMDDFNKIEEFIRSWRRHFLDTLHPRFLPAGWSVDSPVASDIRGTPP